MLFGVDNTFSRARSTRGLFEPYESPELDEVDPELQLDPEHRVTPIDHGDVCLNYDKTWFAERRARAADDARRPDHARVPRPARRREPGDVVARARVPARDDRAVRRATAGRTTGASCAPTTSTSSTAGRRRTTREFSGAAGSKGDRPLVVSYASSPPAEVIFREAAADRRRRPARASDACFRQVEFAGVLRGHRERGRRAQARRLHALAAVPGGHPAADVRVPGARATRRFRRCSSSSRSSPTTPLDAAARGDRREPRALDRRVDRHRAPVSGRAPGGRCTLGGPARVPRAVLRLPGRRDRRARPAPAARRLAARDVLTDPLTRDVVWFTVWQALASTVLTLAVALPGGVRARPATASAAGALVSALVVVPFVLPTVVVALAFLALLPDGVERGWAPILLAHVFFNVRRRRAHRRRRSGRTSTRAWTRRRATLGASPRGAPPRGDAAAARARARRRGRDRLPVHVHVVRRRPHPRRAPVRDARGRDLPPGRRGSSTCRAAAALSLVQLACVVGCRLGRDAPRAATSRDRSAPPPRRDTLRPPRTTREQARRRREPRRCSRCSSGCRSPCSSSARSRSATATGSTRTGRSARPTSVLLVPPCEADRQLARLRGRRDADRRRRRRARRVRASRDSPRAARSTASSCCPLGVSAVTVGFGFLIALDTPPLDFRAAPWLVPIAQALIAIPFVVRILRADAALDRPAPARGGGGARRVARPRAARDRPADRLARARRRRRLRVRDLARRVRRDGVPRPARPADAAGRDLPLPRPARARSTSRRPSRSRSMLMARHRRRRCSSSSGCACAAAGGSDAPGRARRRVAFDGDDGRSTRVDLDVARRRDRRRARPERLRQDDAAARRSPGLQRPDAGRVAARRRRPRRRAAAPARRRAHVPGPRAVPASRRRRQRRVRAAHARATRRARSRRARRELLDARRARRASSGARSATLSGGEQQRVALARALAPEPRAAHARRAARLARPRACATGSLDELRAPVRRARR